MIELPKGFESKLRDIYRFAAISFVLKKILLDVQKRDIVYTYFVKPHEVAFVDFQKNIICSNDLDPDYYHTLEELHRAIKKELDAVYPFYLVARGKISHLTLTAERNLPSEYEISQFKYSLVPLKRRLFEAIKNTNTDAIKGVIIELEKLIINGTDKFPGSGIPDGIDPNNIQCYIEDKVSSEISKYKTLLKEEEGKDNLGFADTSASSYDMSLRDEAYANDEDNIDTTDHKRKSLLKKLAIVAIIIVGIIVYYHYSTTEHYYNTNEESELAAIENEKAEKANKDEMECRNLINNITNNLVSIGNLKVGKRTITYKEYAAVVDGNFDNVAEMEKRPKFLGLNYFTKMEIENFINKLNSKTGGNFRVMTFTEVNDNLDKLNSENGINDFYTSSEYKKDDPVNLPGAEYPFRIVSDK